MKKGFIFGLSVVVIAVFAYQFSNQSTSVKSPPLKPLSDNSTIDSNSDIESLGKTAVIDPTSKISVKTIMPNQHTEPSESSDKLIETDFNSGESITNAFVLENDVISKDALQDFFTIENLDELILTIKNIPPTEQSETREYQLSQNLKVFDKTNYYAESYACAGRICTLSLNYDELKKEELTEFSKFSKNYTFTNTSINEYGEKQLKAIYIATDDPSKLTVR